jgi:hypothetical protein
MRQKISLEFPLKEEVMSRGIEVPLAPKGQSWYTGKLGKYAYKQGVYVIFHNNQIKYVGKTNGQTMDFGTRLRREFQETASQRNHIYPKLEKLQTPPPIYVSFFSTEDLRELIHTEIETFNKNEEGIIEIFEQVLKCAYKPEW